MNRISTNNPVRRRLFPEEHAEEQANIENIANILQESIAKDMEVKSKKWSFDFSNEEALVGRYEWFRRHGDDWIRMKPRRCEEHTSDDSKCSSLQIDNENTPVRVRDDSVPLIRKRKKNMNRNGQPAKRQVTFD